jgi:selenocysteine-specific elongation factor
VDRVFPLKGVGTVVTGTLWSGEVKAGDALVVVPGGARAGVRSVQVHDHEAEVVHAGSRVGMNLRGLDRDDVARGDWLAAPALAGLAGRRFDAWVSVLPGARPLRSGDQVRVHHGTAQYLARVAPLDGREIAPGAAAAAVVRLDADALVLPHDRFIVRLLSPVATIAGGEALLAGAQRWHARERHGAFLESVRAGEARTALRVLAEDRGEHGLTRDDLAAAGFAPGKVAKALAAAVADGELEELTAGGQAAGAGGKVGAGGTEGTGVGAARWFAAGVLAALRSALLAGAAERAAARPERPFISAAELAAVVPALPAADAGLLLQTMAAGGDLVAGEGGYAPAGAGVLGAEQEALAGQVLVRLAADPTAPPTLAVLAEEMRRPPRELSQVLDVLARRGDVVRVDKDLWFARSAVDEARAVLLAQLEGAGEVTLAGFRDAAGCGRRNAQALLEYFDREGVTLRRGDVRVARRRRS